MINLLSSPRPRAYPASWRLAPAAAATVFLMIATGAFAQERYKTPDEAVTALIDAARAAAAASLIRVLGPGSGEIVLSGDAVADADARKRVVDAYDAKHQIVLEGADKAVLIIGRYDWPFPIPLVRKDGSWRFDAARSRPASRMSTRSTSMPRRGSPAMESTPSASSAGRERRMASIGRHNPVRTRARSASSPPVLRRRGIASACRACPITATITGSSPGKGRTPPAARSITSCAAT
jgi:Protein of unknown function (DUF2950)